jgi:hypothetical protein
MTRLSLISMSLSTTNLRAKYGLHAQRVFESLIKPAVHIKNGNRLPDYAIPSLNMHIELKAYSTHSPTVCLYQLPAVCGKDIWDLAIDLDEYRRPSLVPMKRNLPPLSTQTVFYACLHHIADKQNPETVVFDSLSLIPGKIIFSQVLENLAKKQQKTYESEQNAFISDLAQSIAEQSVRVFRSHAVIDNKYTKQRSDAWQSVNLTQIRRIVTFKKKPEDYTLLDRSGLGAYPYVICRSFQSIKTELAPSFEITGFCSDSQKDTLDSLVERITINGYM